jgi:hypothetical protein
MSDQDNAPHNNPPKPFLFIEESGDAPIPTATRRQIRRQAMHDVALARRERGDYGKRNMRQLPVFENEPVDAGVGSSSSRASESRRVAAGPSGPSWSIPPNVSAQGYEQARMEFDFDLLSLSSLTTVHVSRAAVKALSMAPERLVYILQLRESSYMDYAVQWYGSSSVLRNVVDCTMAQAKRVMTPNGPVSETTVLTLYVKALEGLQAALNDPEKWRRPEVLCAAQVLSLFEVCSNLGLVNVTFDLNLAS